MFAIVLDAGILEGSILATCYKDGLIPIKGACYSGLGPQPGYFCKYGIIE